MGRTARNRQHRKKFSSPQPTQFSISGLYQELHAKGWRNGTQLSVFDFPETGRGLCSKTRSFTVDDKLISLPYNCLLTIHTLEADLNFKAKFDVTKFSQEQRISFQALMACYLLYQEHLGTDSPYYHYLSSLPEHFTTPYFCSVNELQCLPDAILEHVVEQNRKIRNSYTILCEVLQNPKDKEKIYALAAFKRAYFVVNTRSVYVDSRRLGQQENSSYFKPLLNDAPHLALAPLLDFFNHDSHVTTKAELVRQQQCSEYTITLMQTPKVLQPYDQLFISYGPLTNFRLLTEYGFFLPDNCHDYFTFSLLDIEHFLKHIKYSEVHRNKFKFIREYNINDQMFVHPAEGMSHNLHVVLHLIFKEASHFPNVLQQVAFGAVDQLEDVSEQLEGLIAFKINEYQGFLVNLNKLGTLSDSAIVAKDYMQACITWLQKLSL